jgi:hypothetical protein
LGRTSWITTNTLLTRYNDAQSLVSGAPPPLGPADLARRPGGAGGAMAMKAVQRLRVGGVTLDKILTPEQRAGKPAILAALERRLFQTALNIQQERALREFLDSKNSLSDPDILTLIRLMMSTPDYQVT